MDGEVGSNAQQAFDEHELAAMVHLVFLRTEQHLKTCLLASWR